MEPTSSATTAEDFTPTAGHRPGKFRELLPKGGKRRGGIPGPKAGSGVSDFVLTQVGSVDGAPITVNYDSALGPQGLALAQQFINVARGPYNDMVAIFGIAGAAITVTIASVSGKNDGSGGAYHFGCDFTSGGSLFLDATFANTTVNPLDLLVGLYVAELSECFMGAQAKGWGCEASNGEGLSRYCAEQETPPGTMTHFATGADWAQAGYPNWVDRTEPTDRNHVSTGCAMVYLYWLRWLGFTLPEIARAGGTTLAANYTNLTGKTTAWKDLQAALFGKFVTSDNPFPMQLITGQLLFYRDRTRNGTGDVNTPLLIGSGGWQEYTRLFSDGNGAIYAVNAQGQLLFYRDWTRSGTDDINSPSVIGLGGWQSMKFIFSGGPGIIYAVNAQGQLLFYRDNTQNGTGDVHSPAVIGQGGWQQFSHLFYGGNGILYAVNGQGQLLFYRDHTQNGTGDVNTPSVIGLGGWQQFSKLFSAGNGIIYAVNGQGQLLFYRDYTQNGTGDVHSPAVIGLGGWQSMKFLFDGGDGILYAVPS
jgi:Tachylectin